MTAVNNATMSTTNESNDVELRLMTTDEFSSYREYAIKEWADYNVKFGSWMKSTSVKMAERIFDDMSPDGIYTAGQYVYKIMVLMESDGITSDSTDKTKEWTQVGIIWMSIETEFGHGKYAMIEDIEIQPEFRRLKYATTAMKLIENNVRTIDPRINKIVLKVHHYNNSAVELYEKLGYDRSMVTMYKLF